MQIESLEVGFLCWNKKTAIASQVNENWAAPSTETQFESQKM